MNLYNYIKHNKPTEQEIANLFSIKKINQFKIDDSYIIGDIHGELELLKELLKNIPINSPIFLVGDIIEKGQKSLETLIFIMKNKNRFKIILGNHELRMLTYLIRIIEDNDFDNIWYKKNIQNNDNQIVEYFLENKNKIKNLYSFFETKVNLGYFLNNKFLITHGYALPFFKNPSNNIDIIKNRNLDLLHNHNNIINIFGHLGTGSFKTNNLICLDDKVYKTKKLTYLKMKNMEIKSIKNYLDLSTKTNL